MTSVVDLKALPTAAILESSGLDARDRLLFQQYGWGPACPVPGEAVHKAIERHAALVPSAIAVEHEGQVLSYGDLDRHADRLAAYLVGNGVRVGDHVALVLRRGIPMVVGILAILKAGAAYVPQDARVTRPVALEHILVTTRARMVLTQSDVPVTLPTGRTSVHIDTFMAEEADFAAVAVDVPPEQGCYVLFTSGTTGMPNGVVVTHANVANLLFTEPGDLGIRPGTVVGQILSIAFDMAAWEILGCLTHGGTLLIRGDDIEATAGRVDVLIATPTILASLDPDRCERARTVAVAGEPCPRPLADRWARGKTFYNGCGPTEVTIVNTMRRHRADAELLTIGTPVPNNTVYILDESGRPCPIGEIGEMWAGGACVSAGYLANPELNATRYAPDPFLGGGRMMFRTRDLARWTPDGQLEHFGRTDDQVKIRGFRVELDSVSAILEQAPGCTRAVTLKTDCRTLVAFVQPETVDPLAARQAVADMLPYYCTPEVVHALPELPMTDRGKIDKRLLAELARNKEIQDDRAG
ncbi:peptide synthetase [Amycolatopsis sp. WAC 04197]|uniref:amino acid adenylation domain-containing protein n=1 Tax=Amycolatopsis sp. WAC 04197 TaxID=2203199 RepID=UPI000F771E83|nr:amino acid adenylation domain-containing protein [Amycolatopsis sp. WAC 04197]RSN45208.1 peptide synthetase [Amycolatopsis sp. WAC 04197]